MKLEGAFTFPPSPLCWVSTVSAISTLENRHRVDKAGMTVSHGLMLEPELIRRDAQSCESSSHNEERVGTSDTFRTNSCRQKSARIQLLMPHSTAARGREGLRPGCLVFLRIILIYKQGGSFVPQFCSREGGKHVAKIFCTSGEGPQCLNSWPKAEGQEDVHDKHSARGLALPYCFQLLRWSLM